MRTPYRPRPERTRVADSTPQRDQDAISRLITEAVVATYIHDISAARRQETA